jgi:hypothetical protein
VVPDLKQDLVYQMQMTHQVLSKLGPEDEEKLKYLLSDASTEVLKIIRDMCQAEGLYIAIYPNMNAKMTSDDTLVSDPTFPGPYWMVRITVVEPVSQVLNAMDETLLGAFEKVMNLYFAIKDLPVT